MGILAWIIVGMIAGWLTGEVMGSREKRALRDLLLGAFGALVGGFFAASRMEIVGSIESFNFVTTLVSLVGAIAAVTLVKAISGRRVAAKE